MPQPMAMPVLVLPASPSPGFHPPGGFVDLSTDQLIRELFNLERNLDDQGTATNQHYQRQLGLLAHQFQQRYGQQPDQLKREWPKFQAMLRAARQRLPKPAPVYEDDDRLLKALQEQINHLAAQATQRQSMLPTPEPARTQFKIKGAGGRRQIVPAGAPTATADADVSGEMIDGQA